MSEIDETPEHAENSPSSAEAWAACEDYINANRGLPDVQSWEAAEGTAAHWVRNECLMNGEDAVNYIGRTQQVDKWPFTWTADDAMLLQPGIDWVRSHPGRIYGEHRVDLTRWLGHDSLGRPQGGTLDVGVICDDGSVIIDDEKWGRGIPVQPRNCKQLMLYGLGFADEHGITDPATRFILSIDQPRHMGGGGKWETTLGELLVFGDWIKERAAATRALNPPRTASQAACMWCLRKVARGGCGQFDRYFIDILGVTLDDLDAGVLTMTEVLTPDRRAVLIKHRKMIEKYLEQMQDQALADALAGLPVGPMKAVYDRKQPDAWLDTEKATAAVVPLLGVKSFTSKLITPTQTGKAVPRDSFDWLLIDPLIKRGERKPALVPEEDDREAIVTAAQINDLEDL